MKGHPGQGLGQLPPVPGGVRTLMPLPGEDLLLAGVPSTSTARRRAAAHPVCQGQPGGAELSEAECDMDTMKKLKLGLRSSLWSRTPRAGTPRAAPVRPSTPGPPMAAHPSDYSIAV